MEFLRLFGRHRGATLFELIIAVAITAILLSTIFLTFDTALKTFWEAQVEGSLMKYLDSIAYIISNGDRRTEGMRGALELTYCSKTQMTFVPLWRNRFFPNEPQHAGNEYDINAGYNTERMPYRYGSGGPIVEATYDVTGKLTYRTSSFNPVYGTTPADDDLIVVPDTVIDPTSDMFILYWPDTRVGTGDPNAAVTLTYDSTDKDIKKTFNGVTEAVSPTEFGWLRLSNLEITGCEFKYFDNFNNEVADPGPDGVIGTSDDGDVVPDGMIKSITAVQLTLQGRAFHGDQYTKELTVFINLRNSRNTNALIIMDEGMSIKLPRADELEVFKIAKIQHISNLTGTIVLTVVPWGPYVTIEDTWKITLNLERKNIAGIDREFITSYQVEYPVGTLNPVITVNHEITGVGFDLLDLAGGEYDINPNNGTTTVNFNCESILTVTNNSGVRGAALSVRP